jgi:hypothetical protein
MKYTFQRKDETIQLFEGKHHFLTIVYEAGIFVLRTHPGHDKNGWGTSLYLQPFFPGAVLRGTMIDSLTPTDTGVMLKARGIVCHGVDASEGEWSAELVLMYDSKNSVVQGEGTYHVSLIRSLEAINVGDLSLFKIASNYLHNVPHYDGSIGDTGDFKEVGFNFDDQHERWDLTQLQNSTFFRPDIKTEKKLVCTLTGNCYDDDSKAQGFDTRSIAQAFKPGLEITLLPDKIYPLSLFAQYANRVDPEATERYGREIRLSETYWHDNVGITPLILQKGKEQEFYFHLTFRSDSIESAQ